MAGDSRRLLSAKPDAKPAAESDRSSVQSLLRAIDLLELLSEQGQGMRLVDIVSLAGIPASTAHRLLTTLEARHFVSFDRDSRCWTVGGRCFTVGAAFGRRRDIGALALPIMRRLRERSDQTVNLALAEASDMILISQTPGRNAPRGIAKPGTRAALTATALGQSIISRLPDAEIGALLKGAKPLPSPKITLPGTIKATRERGYALDDEVNCAGLRCIAAPIFNEFSAPIAAISVAGASDRLKVECLGDISRDVLLAAQEVTLAIGGRVPAFA